MLKPEDFDKFSYDLAKDMSKEGSVIITKLKSGTHIITHGLTNNDSDVRSTENGPVISDEAVDKLNGLDYLFIPEKSNDKDNFGK
jgi:hypothetical protein